MTRTRGPDIGVWPALLIPACLVSAVAHLPVTAPHLAEAPYIGVLFLALEAVCLVLTGVLVLRPTRAAALACALVGAAAVAAYVLSRTVGLPEIGDEVGNWLEPLGVVAVVAETVLVVAGGAAALGVRPVLHVLPRLVRAATVALVAAGSLVVFVVANVSPAVAGMPGITGTAGMSGMSGMSGSAGSATSDDSYWSSVGGAPFSPDGVVRKYYVSADEVDWNYAPTGANGITGRPFDAVAATYAVAGPGRIGPVYRKCLYRGYTDASFATRQHRSAAESYEGILGPVIRAEVGDTIRIVFRNACSFPTSMHPHGVFYTKSSEGAPYADGTSGAAKADDAVPTGGRHVYTWLVPERAGPGPHDGSSVVWMYHSHTNEVTDTYAGLVGPMVVTARGMARADGSPKDVDREVFVDFFIDNEMLSPLLAVNERRIHGPVPPGDDEEFQESNLKHSMNGYLFGNMPMITIHKGERVRWYLMTLGTETDLHTPHWHGNDVVAGGMRTDVIQLIAGGMMVADMVPDDVGTWLFHCHINDHITAGMIERYRVVS